MLTAGPTASTDVGVPPMPRHSDLSPVAMLTGSRVICTLVCRISCRDTPTLLCWHRMVFRLAMCVI
jgi:hypothetical protein